jgi:hypothetical protein
MLLSSPSYIHYINYICNYIHNFYKIYKMEISVAFLMYVCVCVYIYTHTYIHIYIYIYISFVYSSTPNKNFKCSITVEIHLFGMVVIRIDNYPDWLGHSRKYVDNSIKLICLEITVIRSSTIQCYGLQNFK